MDRYPFLNEIDTMGTKRPFDFCADLFAGRNVFENNFFETREVLMPLSKRWVTYLRRLLKPYDVSSMV